MIVPQMQQRWTGYSSEGSRSLLDAVLGARKASANERQAAVNEGNLTSCKACFKVIVLVLPMLSLPMLVRLPMISFFNLLT